MGSNPLYWDAQKMLDLYLLDYMEKKNMHETAAIFKKEADVCATPVVINTPDGFLHEWFSMFHDVYASRHLMAQEAEAEASVVQAMQMRENEGRNKHVTVTQQAMNKQACPQLDKGTSSRQSTGDFGPSLHPLDVKRLNISKPVGINTSHLVQQFSDHDQLQAQNIYGRIPTVDHTLYGLHSAVVPGALHAGMVAVNPRTLEGRPLRIGQRRQTSADQHQHDWLQEQQLLENVRKRQITPYLRSGRSLLGNMNGSQGIPVEDNAESFLSYGDANADCTNTPFRCLRRRTTACNSSEQKGFTFEEVGSLHSSKSKVICCHFSSDGKFLASAGHEKKPLIWNMETFDFVKSSEGHSLLITDVRFQPRSTIFATSSFDRTVKIWDAARSSKPLATLEGHTEQVMSLDFHPRRVNLLCSCDTSDVVRLWNVDQFTSTRVFKGATKQVRFQPRYGKVLATASGNDINVFDLETGNLESFLKRSGHAKDVLSLCWDTSGKYLASVSEDSARIWSLTSNGNCIYELKSNGNRFQSCTFHPGYSLLLIIGGYQCLELWNPIDQGSRTLTVSAHKGLVAGLAESPITEMVASVSHDQCVKIWK